MMIRIYTFRLEFPAVFMLMGPKISAEICLKIQEYFVFATLTKVVCNGDLYELRRTKLYFPQDLEYEVR